MKISVPKETAPGERRVALVPEVVQRLTKDGLEVVVEPGAGSAAGTYRTPPTRRPARRSPRARACPATWSPRSPPPSAEEIGRLGKDAVLIGFLQPLTDADGVQRAGRRRA